MFARASRSLPDSPSSYAHFNGVHLSTRVAPALRGGHGGDWCDMFVLSDDVVALSIGDVSGHGSTAYETMSAIRAAVSRAAHAGLDPAQTLAVANRFVCERAPQFHATALVALLDTRRRTIAYASAGHPPMLIVDSHGGRFAGTQNADLPLGVVEALTPQLRAAAATCETLLVLYTDGITEFDRRPLDGEAKLRRAGIATFDRASPDARGLIDAMFEPGTGRDDAAVIAAWLPHAWTSRSTYWSR